MENGYNIRRRKSLLRFFDNVVKRAKPVLASEFGDAGAEGILSLARVEFDHILPKMPYIGDSIFSRRLMGGGVFLSLYFALRKKGYSVEESGETVLVAGKAFFRSWSPVTRRAAGRVIALNYRIHGSSASEKSLDGYYPGDWKFTYERGNGRDFMFRFTFTECGMCKMVKKLGAEEATPWFCRLDHMIGEELGILFSRAGVLSAGDPVCDWIYTGFGNATYSLPAGAGKGKRTVHEN